MKKIIVASAAPEQLTQFCAALAEASGLATVSAATAEQALEAISRPSALMVVVDGRQAADQGKQLIRQFLMTNAMVCSAVLSDMPETQFHDAMEGLGILMQLPARPDKSDALALWQRFREING